MSTNNSSSSNKSWWEKATLAQGNRYRLENESYEQACKYIDSQEKKIEDIQETYVALSQLDETVFIYLQKVSRRSGYNGPINWKRRQS